MKTHERLQAIIDHIDTISFYCEQCDITTLGNFVANPMAMDACITHIGHIGEQMGRIYEAEPHLFDRYEDIDPNEIRSMRNKLFHDYQGIVNDIVWEVIDEDLPRLKEVVEELIRENSEATEVERDDSETE